MNTAQVDRALQQKFIEEGARLVFWHDADSGFTDYVETGLPKELAGVQVLDLSKVGGLSAKLLLERKDPAGKYLVYSAGAAPAAEDDWLLDIRLYSTPFHADVASLWLEELGLPGLSLRGHLKLRSRFMQSQDRRKKLRRLITKDDNEASLDLKMLAVLVGSDAASTFDVLRALCHGHLQEGYFDLDTPPALFATFEKMGLLDHFWQMMADEFTYEGEAPAIAALLRRLFITELFHKTDDAPMASLAQYKLKSRQQNAVVFLAYWRDSSGMAASYDAAATAVAKEQRVRENLNAYDLQTIQEVFTFWEIEQYVAFLLKEQLITEGAVVDAEAITSVARARKAGHWLAGPGSDAKERSAIAAAYEAIVAAANLLALASTHQNALVFDTPAALFDAYQEHLYLFDQHYRHFCMYARLNRDKDLLKTLAQKVEGVYDQAFLQPLGIAWSKQLDAGFLNTWATEDLPAQQNFYAHFIAPRLAENDRNRAFVIISDAFRYEAARELTEALNGKFRMDAEISAMLGVLPSYTVLGMASLLPHKTLKYKPGGNGQVMVDGKSTAGTAGRDKVLAGVAGIACKAEGLRKMKREDARALIEGKRVVYIYHNIIDARGDSASTEAETFEAVAECITELVELVQFCMNTLNAGKVWITADHGFLYQQEAPHATEKSTLKNKPDHAVASNKRYVIGRNLGDLQEAHYGKLEVTAGAGGDMEFWVPRATNRFNFMGGSRFFHGGAMPQEVVVPVVAVSQLRGKEKENSRIEKVPVQVLGTEHKITTPMYRFELVQLEAVSERKKPVSLRAAIYEEDRPVTTIETVSFDSTSDNFEDRKKSILLRLRTGTFDRSTPYRLVLRDVDTDAEVLSLPVVIDRSFDDDF